MPRWHSCNVLLVGAEARRVWEFDARKNDFKLGRTATAANGQPLPASLVGKTWRSLWQKKLNVAWLPPEQVFLRVAHLPQASFDETLAMVELQLEKLSPLPLAQVVWTFHVLPQVVENQQTVIVTIVARELVEEFLGKLEGQGYLADRLEVAILDQLQSTPAEQDGAWIYPDTVGGLNTALVAWWFGGVLCQIGLVSAPPGEKRGETLCAQLAQMAWAGELEGWLKAAPRLHLVAEPDTAATWEPLLRTGLNEPVDVVKPLPAPELAVSTVRRAALGTAKASLLPAEFTTRYQQQFVDRLWMRSLGAVLVLYLIGVVIYFGALGGKYYQVSRVEDQLAGLSKQYTNSMQLKARYQVLKDRQDLKYAALECYKAAAESLQEGLELQQLDFRDGKKLTLNGTAPAGQEKQILDFNAALRKAQLAGQPLFTKFDQLYYQKDPGRETLSWRFSCELNRAEAP